MSDKNQVNFKLHIDPIDIQKQNTKTSFLNPAINETLTKGKTWKFESLINFFIYYNFFLAYNFKQKENH